MPVWCLFERRAFGNSLNPTMDNRLDSPNFGNMYELAFDLYVL